MNATLPMSSYDVSLIPLNPITIYFFYPESLHDIDIESSFRETLEDFNVFSSQIFRYRNSAEYYLRHSEGGATYRETSVNRALTFDSIEVNTLQDYVDIVDSRLGCNTTAASVIHFDNGTLLSLSVSHAIADGMSLGLFLYSWSARVNGADPVSASSQRRFTSAAVDDFFTEEDLSVSMSDDLEKRYRIFRKPRYYSTIRIEKSQLPSLIGNEYDHLDSRSDFLALTVLTLKDNYEKLSPQSEYIDVTIPIDVRAEHNDLEFNYIGNAVALSTVRFAKTEIASMQCAGLYSSLNSQLSIERSTKRINATMRLAEDGVIHRTRFDSDEDERGDELREVVATTGSRKLDQGSFNGLRFKNSVATMMLAPLPAPQGIVVIDEGDVYLVQVSSPFQL